MSTRPPIFWKLYSGVALTVLVATVGVALFAAAALHRFHERRTEDELRGLARLLADVIAREHLHAAPAAADRFCKDAGAAVAARITVILPDGKVIGDTMEDPARMENHADRPEIRRARRGATTRQIRYSRTIRSTMIYVATPLRVGGRLAGVVRVSRTLRQVDEELARLHRQIAVAACGVAVVAAALCWIFSRSVTGPIGDIRRRAEDFSQGRFMPRIPPQSARELNDLAAALNDMGTQLDRRIRELTEERNETAAVLSSMTEAVIAVDAEGRVITVNDSARRLFEIRIPQPRQHGVEELLHHAATQQFIRDVLQADDQQDRHISLHAGDGERQLHACGTRLRDEDGRHRGAVAVFSDVTELRRLEQVRREFVANVSHELRTPITALKGFVETLLQGAKDEPEQAERFLHIILRQTERLNAIITDLMLLARMEADDRPDQRRFARVPLDELVDSAIAACRRRTDERHTVLDADVAGNLAVRGDRQLLEQALVNLLTNAINYSAAGSTVRVTAAQTPNGLTLAVGDQGPGIPTPHLSRIFERFYRVDKGRSRQVGGTGLGLSIVKHIMQFHGGRVSVTSETGVGSTFVLHFPRAAAAHDGRINDVT